MIERLRTAVDELQAAAAMSRGADLAPAERDRWARAETLQDLCDLTSGWLRGDLISQPGYDGPVDVDEDQAPGLVAALIAANGVGFCTRASQAGYDGVAWGQDDGWSLLAAVDGWAGEATVRRLREGLDGSGLRIQAQHHGRRMSWDHAVEVTFHDDEPVTSFGVRMSRRFVRRDLAGAGRAAIRQAQNALDVVVWDPEPGRNILWPVLRKICALPSPAVVRAPINTIDLTRPYPGPSLLQAINGIQAADASTGHHPGTGTGEDAAGNEGGGWS